MVDGVQEVQGGQGEDDQDPSPVPEEKPAAKPDETMTIIAFIDLVHM